MMRPCQEAREFERESERRREIPMRKEYMQTYNLI